MSNARVIDAADAAAALIKTNWVPVTPDAVQRAYAPRINLTEDAQPVLVGRQVYVFPGPYDATPLTRDEQWRRFTLQVLVVERYTDAGAPPDDWLDERTAFVEQQVFNRLANQLLKLVGEMTPDPEGTPAVEVLYDRDLLVQHKTFWSVCTFPFVEGADLTGAHP